ncbi:RAI1-domain-containing protein [Phlebopus sp. FC_14]|nr:RAI1-domain-containing protein [Phlebopus sp. FC_14]
MAPKRKAVDEVPTERPTSKQRSSSVADLPYPNLSHKPAKPPLFQRPSQLLTFSYTPQHVLEFTDSALRYFIEPPRGADLGYGYDRWIRRPEERGRLDALLTGWSKFKTSFHSNDASSSSVSPPDVSVMSWRGIMTKILIAPYEEREGWELNVMRVRGTLYFEEHLSDAKLKEKSDMDSRHRLQTYYGYAFESYCTSSIPGRRDDAPSGTASVRGWGGDVNTNVQWCSIVKTKLGDRRIVIGGEVDCVRGKYAGNTDNFVELKTSLSIRGPSDELKFEKKLLKFYIQSFLLGVPEIVVGFRKPSGHLTTIQSFQTVQIPRLVRGKPGAWDPLICLEWSDKFLSFLQETIPTTREKDVWRVTFVPKVGITATVLDEAGIQDVVGGDDRIGFLPRWYWDEVMATPAGEATSPSLPDERTIAPAPAASNVPSGWRI